MSPIWTGTIKHKKPFSTIAILWSVLSYHICIFLTDEDNYSADTDRIPAVEEPEEEDDLSPEEVQMVGIT